MNSVSKLDNILIIAVLIVCLVYVGFSDKPQIGILIMLAFIWNTLMGILTKMEKEQ